MVVPRSQMRPTLARLLRFFGAPRVTPAPPAPVPEETVVPIGSLNPTIANGE
jgi:hypothetical protein